MLKDINNVIRIPSNIKDNFFKYWVEFLRPFHHLADKEMNVLASMIAYRFELSKDISSEDIINSILMNADTRKMLKDACGISYPYLQVIMTKFRKAKIIADGKLNPKFLPNVKEDGNSFKLLLLFEF